MYSNKKNVNILTSLLQAHGVEHAVVCPGSRNAPIANDLNECPAIACHPVTDERSAAFCALGIALATRKPTVVCVTSGSALLNTAPAAAEAFYRHAPLVIVSADRPAQWIGQLDGQTMPQEGALGCFVRRSVSLPEPRNDEEEWMCNRLMNEAMCSATYREGGPVHINVPVSEPLFDFSNPKLPQERTFTVHQIAYHTAPSEVLDDEFRTKRHVLYVFGQTDEGTFDEAIQYCSERNQTVFNDATSYSGGSIMNLAMPFSTIEAMRKDNPDLIVYVGGTLIDKGMRRFLRRSGAPTWLITTDGSTVPDPTMHLAKVIECDSTQQANSLIKHLVGLGKDVDTACETFWTSLRDQLLAYSRTFEPPFSQMSTVKTFEQELSQHAPEAAVHYANSTAVRLANIYARHYVWCNRGLNGIEGSLSTASGFAMARTGKVFCTIGDLSFFYDQNALWNASLRGNFRILLLNNGCGGIFGRLPGLSSSGAAREYIGAAHHTEASGICSQNNIVYSSAHCKEEAEEAIRHLVADDSDRPMLLEVFTDAAEDNRVMGEYAAGLSRKLKAEFGQTGNRDIHFSTQET